MNFDQRNGNIIITVLNLCIQLHFVDYVYIFGNYFMFVLCVLLLQLPSLGW